MKPIDYKQYKKMQKMSLNELNRWFLSIWESGVQAEKEKEEASIKADENIAWYSDEELYEKLLTIPMLPDKKVKDENISKTISAAGQDH